MHEQDILHFAAAFTHSIDMLIYRSSCRRMSNDNRCRTPSLEPEAKLLAAAYLAGDVVVRRQHYTERLAALGPSPPWLGKSERYVRLSSASTPPPCKEREGPEAVAAAECSPFTQGVLDITSCPTLVNEQRLAT